jgi:hypothetical protein
VRSSARTSSIADPPSGDPGAVAHPPDDELALSGGGGSSGGGGCAPASSAIGSAAHDGAATPLFADASRTTCFSHSACASMRVYAISSQVVFTPRDMTPMN